MVWREDDSAVVGSERCVDLLFDGAQFPCDMVSFIGDKDPFIKPFIEIFWGLVSVGEVSHKVCPESLVVRDRIGQSNATDGISGEDTHPSVSHLDRTEELVESQDFGVL